MPAEYHFLSFLIRETPVAFMLQGCCTVYPCGMPCLAMLYVLFFGAVLEQVFTDHLGRDADVVLWGSVHCFLQTHACCASKYWSRHYILPAALWLAALLGTQRQTINIVLLVFVVVLFFSCDNLLQWLKNWWPNSLPCSSNINILLINCIKALICLNSYL